MSKSLSLERERFRNGISFDNGLFIRFVIIIIFVRDYKYKSVSLMSDAIFFNHSRIQILTCNGI